MAMTDFDAKQARLIGMLADPDRTEEFTTTYMAMLDELVSMKQAGQSSQPLYLRRWLVLRCLSALQVDFLRRTLAGMAAMN
jgi:hypothetical protein